MATTAQITAALANAQQSTGPRTAEGKAASSRNATKLGIFSEADILPGEDPEEYQSLINDFEEEYQPVGTAEVRLVHEIARAAWLDYRFNRIEKQFYDRRFSALSPEDLQYPLGAIFSQDAEGPNVLTKLERRRNSARRRANSARGELLQLQQDRFYNPPFPEPEAEAVTEFPVNQIRPNPVRFDSFPNTLNPRPWSGGPTPVHTPKDNWDNPALRL